MLLTLVACSTVACGRGEDALEAPEIRTGAGGYSIVHNRGPWAWRDTLGWRLVADGVIAPAGDPLSELVDPYALGLDRAGNLYVNERRDAHIKVFSPSGAFLRRIGWPGEGPGEFRGLVMTMRNDTIVAHDPRLSRTSLLDPSGALLASWPSIGGPFAHIAAERDGGIVIPGEVGRREEAADQGVFGAFGWVRYDPSGAVRDTLYGPPDLDVPVWHYYEGPNRQHSIALIPFMPVRVRVRTPDGLLLHGTSDQYRLALSGSRGDTVRLIEREAPAVPIPDTLRQEVVATRVARTPELRDVAKVSDVPATYPRYVTPWVSEDGTIWVPVPHEGRQAARFDVFDPEGRLLGQVANPVPAASYWLFTPDRAFAVDLNAGDGPAILVFRIAR